MTDTVIQVEGLGKRYRIGAVRERYVALRDVLSRGAKSFGRQLLGRRPQTPKYQEFWALKDVSFEVKQGECVGIIGRNGAGKSTLLKLLSRITEPTEGRFRIRGRVASLLEVGSGFHPELTGRENVYLNGSILGMSRKEIDRKFDEIVTFAEVEKFLDTAVKYYSSGMYMRLAFAVAAHLEPEILVVDEVLAVGDTAFQKKCLGKMDDVVHQGRTVFFVSHNMAAISSLCSCALLLTQGRLEAIGATVDVTSIYQKRYLSLAAEGTDLRKAVRRGTGRVRFTEIRIQAENGGAPAAVAYTGSDVRIEVTVEARQPVEETNVAVILFDINGYRLSDINTALRHRLVQMSPGQGIKVRFTARDLLLRPGTYLIGLWVGRHATEEMDVIDGAASLTIADEPGPSQNMIAFPSPYACRFDVEIT